MARMAVAARRPAAARPHSVHSRAVYEYNFGTATFATFAKGMRATCDVELCNGGALFETICLLCHGKSGVVVRSEPGSLGAATTVPARGG
jgi:cytochrome c